MRRPALLLNVSVSGYYEWRDRAPCTRMVRHTWLLDQIRMVHDASRGVYGARRVHAELTLGHGIRVGHGQVELVMARAGLKGVPGHRGRRARHETPTASDLVERNFTREVPSELWVTDIERHEAFLNLAVVKGHRSAPVAAGV